MNQQYYAKKQQYYASTAESIAALGKRLMDNLCKEIVGVQPMPKWEGFELRPKQQSKYKFSRAYWYIAEFDDRQYFEVEKWCAEQFGPHPQNPDAWSRWYHKYQDRIHFRDKEDYIMFKLRWGE